MIEPKKEAGTAIPAYVKSTQSKSTNKMGGKQADFLVPDVKPWPEEVDGVALADDLVATIKKYVYLPDGAAEVAAMWVLHTYVTRDYTFSPRLFIHSPEPRCGKTTFLDILEYLCYRPLQVSSITGPSMARMITIQKGTITLLADEADRYLNNDNDTLCKVLNSGFQRGKKIMCTEMSGRSMKPKLFDCFAPCAIAAIGNIPITVKDRSLTITMKRKTNADKIEKMRYRQVYQTMGILRCKCKRFIMDHEQEIIDCVPDVPDVLNDRTADVSEILFAIADTISQEWHIRLETAILKLVKTNNDTEENSVRVQLLIDIKGILQNVPNGWLSSNDLVDKLNDIETSPWPEWNKGKPMSTNALARQLKFFGIYPRQKRELYDDRSRKYYFSDFEDAFTRYIPVSSCDTVTTGTNADTDCHTVTVQSGNDDLPDIDF
jgi:putative DNA primase/helicase